MYLPARAAIGVYGTWSAYHDRGVCLERPSCTSKELGEWYLYLDMRYACDIRSGRRVLLGLYQRESYLQGLVLCNF